MLFYILWNNYHWGGDTEVFIFKIHNPQLDRIGDRAASRYILLEPTAVRPNYFLRWYGEWSGHCILQNNGGVAGRLSDK